MCTVGPAGLQVTTLRGVKWGAGVGGVGGGHQKRSVSKHGSASATEGLATSVHTPFGIPLTKQIGVIQVWCEKRGLVLGRAGLAGVQGIDHKSMCWQVHNYSLLLAARSSTGANTSSVTPDPACY